MKTRLARFLITLTLLASLEVSAIARVPDWPSLKTDEQKVSFLLWLKNQFPENFKKGAAFPKDWLKLLDGVQTAMDKLKKSQIYQRLLAKRPDPISIQLYQEHPGKELDGLEAGALARWQAELRETLHALGPDPRKALFGNISKDSSVIAGGRVSNLIPGLVRFLPKELQKSVYTEPSFEKKIEAIEASLPENILAAGFRPELWGFSVPSDLTGADAEKFARAKVFQRIEELRKAEADLRRSAELYVALRNEDGTLSTSETENLDKIAKLGSRSFGFLGTRETIKTEIEDLASRLPPDHPSLRTPKGRSDLLATISELITAHLTPALISRDVKVQKTDWKLVEVPAQISIDRGDVGDDCTTTMTPLYVTSPKTRVFYVYDPNGKLRGYFDTVEVEYDGKPGLYFSGINGASLNYDVTKRILQTLDHAKGELGYDQLFLFDETNLPVKTDNAKVRSHLEELIKGKKTVTLEFPDAQLRKRYFDPVSGKWDEEVEMNETAVPYEPPKDAGAPPAYKIEKIEFPTQFTQPVTRTAALELGLDVAVTDLYGRGERIAKTGGMSSREFNRIFSAVKNRKKLPVAEYLKTVSEALRAEGIPADDVFVDKNLYLFQEGLLRSPDVLEARATTAREYVKLIKSQNASGTLKEAIQDFIARTQDRFFAMNPSVSEVVQVRKQTSTYDDDFRLVRRAMPLVKSAADFNLLTDYLNGDPEEDHFKQFEKLLDSYVDKFMSLNPSPAEALTFGAKLSPQKRKAFFSSFEAGLKESQQLQDWTAIDATTLDPREREVLGDVLRKFKKCLAEALQRQFGSASRSSSTPKSSSAPRSGSASRPN